MMGTKTEKLAQIFELFVVAFGLTATLLFTGCEPNKSTNRPDETQGEVQQANAAIARMADLEHELRRANISLMRSVRSESIVSNMNRRELDSLKPLLEQYITQGQIALRVAIRVDVAFDRNEQKVIELKVANAQGLLAQTNKRLGRTLSTDLDSEFWASFRVCQYNQNRNLDLYGIHILRFDRTHHAYLVHRMNLRARREIAERIRIYLSCQETLSRGYEVLYDGAVQAPGGYGYDVAGQKLDPSTQKGSQAISEKAETNTKLNELLDLLKTN